MQISLLTYNIHKGFSVGNVKFILHRIKEALGSIGADLVFLQEIQGEHAKREKRIEDWPEIPQFEFLATNNWSHYAYGKNAIYRSGHHGNAILSKFPFVRWENIDLSKHKRASRSLLHGVLQLPGVAQQVHVICIHFALFKTERNKQLSKLKEHISDNIADDAPLLIAGDFNDWRGHAEHYLEAELGLHEAFKVTHGNHAKTFPSWKPKLPVDRIYYRNVNLLDCERLFQDPWRTLSDHVPLYAEFSLS